MGTARRSGSQAREEKLRWPEDAKFLSDGVYDQFKNGVGSAEGSTRGVESKFEESETVSQLADQLEDAGRSIADGWDKDFANFLPIKGMATRESLENSERPGQEYPC